MDKYTFTEDWMTSNIPIWQQILPILPYKNSFLEVGSYEGRSSIWFIENGISENGEITCIDNWSWNHSGNIRNTFNENILKALKKNPSKRVVVIEGSSYEKLAQLIIDKKQFDFIYIDGGHGVIDVLSDACMSWRLLKIGGIISFDDYFIQDVKLAIDAFCNLHKDKIQYIYIGKQVVIQRMA